MIGLMFFGAAILWLVIVFQVMQRVPKWLNLKSWQAWLTQIVVALVLLVGPFVDHIVGMQQFEMLCEEQIIPRISSEASSVEWANRSYSGTKLLPGFWVNVEANTVFFTDDESKKIFIEYEYFRTKGGRIAEVARVGGWYSCSAPQTDRYRKMFKEIPAYQKIINGVEK